MTMLDGTHSEELAGEELEPIGSAPWTEPQKWLGFFFGALLVVIFAGKLIG